MDALREGTLQPDEPMGNLVYALAQPEAANKLLGPADLARDLVVEDALRIMGVVKEDTLQTIIAKFEAALALKISEFRTQFRLLWEINTDNGDELASDGIITKNFGPEDDADEEIKELQINETLQRLQKFLRVLKGDDLEKN